MEWLFCSGIVVAICSLIWWYVNRNSLPGPIGLPFVGYAPFLTERPYIKLKQLAKKYGPIYSVKIGGKDVLVLADFQSISTAFKDEAFMGKSPDEPFLLSERNVRTNAFRGFPWKEQRRFLMYTLKEFGFGKTQTEQLMREEVIDLVSKLRANCPGMLDSGKTLRRTFVNNIVPFMIGKRLDFEKGTHRLDDALEAMSSATPSLVECLKPRGKPPALQSSRNRVVDFFREEVERHEATLDKDNIRDFFDAYLLETKKRQVSDPDGPFHKDVLMDMARGVSMAGFETIRTALEWTLLVLAEYPEVLEKVQVETDEVLGADGFPTFQDRLAMPYTEAVVCEVLRWAFPVPLNMLRYTLLDSRVGDYFVPKHTHVLANLYSVHMDEDLWGSDVNRFRPERFLSLDGKKVVKPPYFIPFSTGKRACPGKMLAEIEMFIYVAVLAHRFTFSFPPGERFDKQDVIHGLGVRPRTVRVIIEVRKKKK